MKQMRAEAVEGTDRPFFDSNVVIYAFVNDPLAGNSSRTEIAERLLGNGGMVGIQTLNEFANVAHRKLRVSWGQVQTWISQICMLCPSPVPVTFDVHVKATSLAERYGFSFYDSLMIAAALESSCNVLYSEDMQDGQVIEGLTIRNPFGGANSTPN